LISQKDSKTYLLLRYGLKPISATSNQSEKQVIDNSAKTAIPKLFNSIFLHNLFLLKILAIKKAIQT
jgi:hypothetical protein